MGRWFWLALLVVSACAPSSPNLSLFPTRAALGEEVEARLSGMASEGAQVFVGGTNAMVTAREGSTLRFRVPNVSGGPLVAGAIALWLSAQPNLTPVQVQQNLEQYAKLLPFSPQEVGKGMMDLSP